MKVLLSGSSGFLGSPLVASLESDGHEVYRLVRGKETLKDREVAWDIKAETVDLAKLEQVLPDIVIHLAGENIMGTWTEAKKKDIINIIDSRVKGTALLCESLLKLSKLPRAVISASGISYYGNRGDEEVDESSSKGNGFLSEVTLEWEKKWDNIRSKGVPVFTLRIGVVLSPTGGALQAMRIPFYIGFGGVMGTGKQWMSWISLWDVIRVFLFIIKDVTESKKLVSGPINVVGPKPVQNYEFTKTLGRIMWRPTLAWLPQFAVRLALGRELADETALSSVRVIPRALLSAGFSFCDNNVEDALRNELYTKVGRVAYPAPSS